MPLNFYEDLRRARIERGSSDRQFGLVIAAALALLGLWPLHAGGPPRMAVLVVAGAFLILSLVRPAALKPLNRTWTLLGLLLARVTNPIVMCILFFLVFTPVALIARLFGKDMLRLKLLRNVDTYWIPRNPPGPAPETMSKQF